MVARFSPRSTKTTIVLFALVCAACSPADEVSPGDQVKECTGVLIAPHSIGLAVGDSTQFAVSYDQSTPCTPPAPVEQLRWSSSDQYIARVDSVSGVISGVAADTVQIGVHLPGTTAPLGTGRVVVFAPLLDRIITIRQRITCHDPSCQLWSGNGPIGIWTVSLTGVGLQLVRDSMRYPDHPRVSPDGRNIVFDEWDTLYVMDGAGQVVRPVPTGLPSNVGASWSPDGQWILFSGFDAASGKFQLYRIHPNGSGLRHLTDDPFGASQASFSPDGSTIAFVRDSMANSRQAGAARLMDTSGANIRVASGDSTPFYGRYPEWSPDGNGLVFIDNSRVRRLVLATGAYDTIGAYFGNRPASWSPDGTRILISGGDISYLDPAKRYPNNGYPLLPGLGPDSMISWSAFYTPKR